VEAAGSSLLYSREFYDVIKRRLAPGGLLQQWFPGGDIAILSSVTKALQESFPHVRVFPSIFGWGFHFLASMEPIPTLDAAALAGRLPPDAATDLIEWYPHQTPLLFFEQMLGHEFEPSSLADAVPDAPTLADDRPYNEYFFLRWLAGRRRWVQPG
jgi:spermidine synthase